MGVLLVVVDDVLYVVDMRMSKLPELLNASEGGENLFEGEEEDKTRGKYIVRCCIGPRNIQMTTIGTETWS